MGNCAATGLEKSPDQRQLEELTRVRQMTLDIERENEELRQEVIRISSSKRESKDSTIDA
jgi:hypothetical protein